MKYNLIFILTAVIFFFACSDDDDSLSGTYELTFMSQSNCTNAAENFELSFADNGCDTFSGIEFCRSGTLNISENGTFTSTIQINATAIGLSIPINGNGNYVRNGSTITLCLPDCSDLTISGNQLIGNTTSSGGCDQTVEFTRI